MKMKYILIQRPLHVFNISRKQTDLLILSRYIQLILLETQNFLEMNLLYDSFSVNNQR